MPTDRRNPPPPPDLGAVRAGAERPTSPPGQRPATPRPAQARPRAPKQRSLGSRVATVLLGLGVAVLALVLAVTTFLLIAQPTDLVRDQIVQRVKAATGRDLVIAGPTSFTIFPSLGLSMRKVSLAGPPGASERPTVTIEALDVTLKLLPLLSREARIERLVLHKPVLDLWVDADGRRSWDIAALNDVTLRPVRLAQAGRRTDDAGPLPAELKEFARNTTDSSKKPASIALEQIELGDVRIDSGIVRFADARAALQEEIAGLDARFRLKSIASPLETDGALDWRGERVTFDAKIATPKAALEQRPLKVQARFAARPAEAAFDGTISLAGTPEASGDLDAKAPSLPQLAAWLRRPLPALAGHGPAAVKGQVKAGESSLALSSATLVLDQQTATGTVSLDLGPARPVLKANLKLAELDLNRLAASRQAGAASSPTPAAPAARPQSIEDLLGKSEQTPPPATPPGPKVKGFVQRTGWSDEPIDVAALGLLDADAKLSIGRLRIGNLSLAAAQSTVSLKNRALKATLDDAQLYEGKGRGFLTLEPDAGGPGAQLGVNLQLEGVASQPLLRDAASLDTLAGRGTLTLALAGRGQSQRQLVETLNGKADIALRDGAVVGWSVDAMIAGLKRGQIPSLERSPAAKTDFTSLTATFAIKDGVAEGSDLVLTGPSVHATGAGKVDLARRQIDYLARPRLARSDGATGVAGLELPLRIAGPLEKPAVTAAIGGVNVDTRQAVDTVKEIGRQLKGKSAGEAVRELLGPSNEGEAAAGTGTEKPKARQLLDKLLKR